MDQCSLIELLGQASGSEAGEIFREYLRGGVRMMLTQVMAAEVAELCGPKYHPSEEATCRRAGSASGYVVWEGNREDVKRPRARRQKDDGSTEEVHLRTYESARQSDQLNAMILRALSAGVSGREMGDVHPESPNVSKSSVSRLWIQAGGKLIDELRSRDIASRDWLALILDGIVLSKDQTAIVAVGVSSGGTKHILDFSLGSTENYEVCRDLMGRLVDRGFAPTRRLLSVLAGSAALKKAVLRFFPDAVIQRCLVHKERNIRARLSRRDWGELARLFKRLRQVEGEEAAREVLHDLEDFLGKRNAESLSSLREAGDELIALHILGVPSTLHRNLLSTNLIENSFRNTRRKLGRVTRFRAETDQASRWLAYALLEVEKGFHRLSGWRDLPALGRALERPPVASRSDGAASPLRAAPSAPSPPHPAEG
ncbi:MAG: IS256 family transposase [bacterium]|nr:IS256 family transposase [bacterium]